MWHNMSNHGINEARCYVVRVMGYNFKPCDREQLYLMPPSLREWLPEGDLAWFVLDAVDQMDLSGFYGQYRSDGIGASAFEPSMMVALLLYAYCRGERSSRRIESLCEKDIGFRVVSANQKPDHATIARFRRNNAGEFERLFVEILRLCVEAGLVKVGVVALDGTKVKANASLAANRTHVGLETEVKKILSEAEAKDTEEDRLYGDKRGDELPQGLRDRKSRLARLQECKARLDREANKRAKDQKRKIEERSIEEKRTGRKKRGRKPKAPDDQPDAQAKANVTDPQSRIMKTRSGYVQGYNGQAVVTEEQIIVAGEITQEANDVSQLHPMVSQTAANLKEAGLVKPLEVVLGDAGYFSESNMKEVDPEGGPELILATAKDWKQRQEAREKTPPRGRIPRNLTPRQRMERKLETKRGRALYKKRGQTVEPVFGQMKQGRGLTGFLLRGLEGAALEWKLLCQTHNLLKLWRSGMMVRV